MPGIDYSAHAVNTSAAQSAAAAAARQAPAAADGFSFGDFLDIINPLQHIPLVSTLYRHLTGDAIGTPEKIAGDTLYGGLVGFVSSIADSAYQAITGKDFGNTLLALVDGDTDGTPPVAVASNDAAPAAQGGGNAARALHAYGKAASLVAPY
jgi:hypothetical protein